MAAAAATAKERAEQRVFTEECCRWEAPFTLHPNMQDVLMTACEAVAPFRSTFE